MKLKVLILLLFGMCLKNVAASEQKKRGGGRLKKIVGVSFLLLNDVMAAATTTTKDIVCPTTLPPYSFDMMNYIRCGEKEDTDDFFDKYVTVRYSNDKIVNENCSTIATVYQKVKNFGKCASEKFTSIVSGAQQKILGKTLNRIKELQMFEEYLVNVDGVDDKVEALLEAFEKLNTPDFFQIKRAADFFKKYQHMNTAEALELALTPKNQKLDFDKVDRMMPYVKTMRGTADELIKEALEPKYQIIDFDRVDSVRQQLALYGLDKSNGIMELVEPINQNLNWEKVIRMMPYAKIFANNEYDAIEEKFRKVKPIHIKLSYKLSNSWDNLKSPRKLFCFVANEFGPTVGDVVGSVVGDGAGAVVGDTVGAVVGDTVGPVLGDEVGTLVGKGVEYVVGEIGKSAGDALGSLKCHKIDTYLKYNSYNQILEAIKPEYQKLDFDKADYIHSLLLKTTSNKFDAATAALSVKYQNYDVSRMRKVFEGVNSLILKNSKYAAEQALKPWIQEKSFGECNCSSMQLETICTSMQQLQKKQKQRSLLEIENKRYEKNRFTNLVKN